MAVGNKLSFDVNGNVEDFIFILSTKDYRHLGALQNVIPDSVAFNGNLNSADTINFEVYKAVTKDGRDTEEPLWEEIDNLKLVYARELDEYFEITVQMDDTADVIKKTITGTSLCEAELGQTYIRGLEANTETDIGRDGYVPTVFYSKENPSASLLHRALSEAVHYNIMHVDESLCNLQRTFSVDEVAVYDWLTGECAKEFNCLFMFDSTNRGIYVYDLYTVCKGCGYRGEYTDECPECGSMDLDYFGDDTTIYIDKENLTDAIQFTTDVGAIKNCFNLVAGDDIITAMVLLINMNGTGFLFFPTDKQMAEMPEELRNKIVSYNEKYLSKKDGYEKILLDLFAASSKIDELTHTMMPGITESKVTAKTEADKLYSAYTSGDFATLGLSSVTTATSMATVESALINYAKVFIKTGYVRVDVASSSYKYAGTDSNGWNYGTWTGSFKITSYSDENDVAETSAMTITVHDNYQDFIEQKIMKNVASNSDEEDSVFDVFSIRDLTGFKEALTVYCLERLKSFYDAVQSALDVLIETGQAQSGAELYSELYLPYYQKLQACQSEIDTRQADINKWQNTYDSLLSEQQKIQSELNFQDYLGKDLYTVFCMYRREDTYKNEHYISDGLTDSEILQKAKDFIETAEKELEKARTPNHSISSTLYNLLLMPEFKPITDHFKLGNWLRICVDGTLYRLRLIGYRLSFSSIQNLEVTFSNATKVNGVTTERDSIADMVKSMASTYDYYANQAIKGSEASLVVNDFMKHGLNSALIAIKNNNNEELVTDRHGLLCRTYDDITGNYAPEQLIITHNILAYTDSNWADVKCALGSHDFYRFDETGKLVKDTAYGFTADFITAGYVYGSQIISGEIYSENYSSTTGSHINLKTGGFTLGGGKLVYDPVENTMQLKGINIEWSSSTTPEISNIDGLEDNLAEKVEKDLIISTINKSVETISIKASKISLEGLVTANENFKILEDGSVESVNGSFSGNINATGGAISGDLRLSGNLILDDGSDDGYQVRLQTASSGSSLSSILSIMNDSQFVFGIRGDGYLHAIGGGYIVNLAYLDVAGDLTVRTDLTVEGTKNRKVTTENYNDRLLYCYEMPSPMFGDIGEGTIDDTGKCYVFMDDIFVETIDMDCTYQVFLQAYGKGECYVAERTSSYFVVEGTENLPFAWEIKAVQKGYDTVRLEGCKENEADSTDTILYETSDYLNSLLYNTESEEF